MLDYHQTHHFIARSPWETQPLYTEIARDVDRQLGGTRLSTLVLDPTGFPKQGNHSVGVARQWLGCLGKVDNGQVGVLAALVRGRDAAVVDTELYLPKKWIDSPTALDKAGVPHEHRHYRSAEEIALAMVDRADTRGLRYNWLCVDTQFGKCPWLMDALDARGKQFVADIPKHFRVYTRHPQVSHIRKRDSGIRKNPSRLRLKPKLTRVDELVARADGRRWRRVHIRPSTTGPMTVEVLHLHVWVVGKDGRSRRRHLLVRRDRTENQFKIKYSLSNASLSTTTEELAYIQAQRFWVEHAIKESKQQLGMDEYQVRLWRAWHHFLAMIVLVGLFLLEQRLEHQQDIPMLSAADIRFMAVHAMGRRFTFEERTQILARRHRQRAATLGGNGKRAQEVVLRE